MTSVRDKSLTVKSVRAPQRDDVDLFHVVDIHRHGADVRTNRNRSRWPTGAIFSPTLEPLNCKVSAPPWPSTVSLPSPGFQTNVSSPRTHQGRVVAAAAVDRVVAVAAEQKVVAVTAGDGVIAGTAIDGE